MIHYSCQKYGLGPFTHTSLDYWKPNKFHLQRQRQNIPSDFFFFTHNTLKSWGLFTAQNKTKSSTFSRIFYVKSYRRWAIQCTFEEVHPLYKTLRVYASQLCFLQDALVCNWQGALIFITCRAVMGVWVGSGEEVPDRAADVSEGMEITSHNSNDRTEISRRSLIFIEHNTSHTKHNTD